INMNLLERIQRGTHEMSHGGFDSIRVTERRNDFTGVALCNGSNRLDHALLHLDEAFTVWKATSRWGSLNFFPHGKFLERGELRTCPLATDALDQDLVHKQLLL